MGGLTPTFGFTYLVVIFAASVVAGSDPTAPPIGALIIDITMQVASSYVAPDYSESVAFGLLILALLIRPQGIFRGEIWNSPHDYVIITVATFALIYAVAATASQPALGMGRRIRLPRIRTARGWRATLPAVVVSPAPAGDTGLTYILGLKQSPIVGALAAMVVSSLISLIVGAIALRSLRQVFFGITTFAAVLILSAVITQETALFNGFGSSEPGSHSTRR